MTTAGPVALLGQIPPDVRAALDGDARLVDVGALAAMDAGARGGIARGLTSAIGGADAQVLAMLPGLRTIVSVGAGTDRFDMADLERRGITLHSTPDVMTEDTAEYAVALVFATLRGVVANDRFVRRGDWASARAPLGRRVTGRRVGIVGLGRIGGRVAEKLSAMGCEVTYTARAAKDVRWSFVADVGDLAQAVDVLTLTCAGGERTRGLVDAAVLDRLGPEGVLVNVSRGSVVDEPSLIAALEEGRIAGAALDVFGDEPTPDARFADLQNCILSPHAATFTRENRRDLIAVIRRLLGLNQPAGA